MDNTKSEQKQHTQPTAPATPAVVSVKGAYFEQKIKRTVSEEVLGQTISQVKSFDAVVGAKITRLAGEGHSERFNEPYVTLEGHYAPGKFVRLTGFSQNSVALKSLLSRKDVAAVNAVGDPMQGFGMNVRELEVIKTDGTRETVISDPNAKAVATPALL